MSSRKALHSGTWYSDHGPTLADQLDQWLNEVPDEIPGVGTLPIPGARIIIAPYVLHPLSFMDILVLIPA
jgi:predicted class III extradiol MEMO1 family dioxygenase